MRGTQRPEVIARRKAAFASSQQADIARASQKRGSGVEVKADQPVSTPEKHGARILFHHEAFEIWNTQHLSIPEVARKIGKSQYTVLDWSKKEGWVAIAKKIAEKAVEKVVETESDQLAKIKTRQLQIAEKAQLAILAQLEQGHIQIDPMTGLLHEQVGGDGKLSARLRPLSANEINQLMQGFQKVADLEFSRAGGMLAPATPIDIRFPDLMKMLQNIRAEMTDPRPTTIDVTPRRAALTAAPGTFIDPREAE